MIKIKFYRGWWALMLIVLLSYPIAAMAAINMGASGAVAPFTVGWVGVWIFAALGGLSAGFIKVDEVDAKLRYPVAAKLVIGLAFGMVFCLAIEALTSTAMGVLPLFAWLAACFSAPICAGFMVYLSNQRRLDDVFDLTKDVTTMRVLGRKTKGDYNESD